MDIHLSEYQEEMMPTVAMAEVKEDECLQEVIKIKLIECNGVVEEIKTTTAVVGGTTKVLGSSDKSIFGHLKSFFSKKDKTTGERKASCNEGSDGILA